MGISSFKKISNLAILLRLTVPALLVFGLGIFLMGFVAGSPAVRPYLPQSQNPGAISRGGALLVARTHLQDFGHALKVLPGPCWTGNTVSEFQSRQCDQDWRKLGASALVLSCPVLLALLFYLLVLDSIQLTYRRLRKRAEKGKGAFTGTVTEPARLPNDLYGFIYCMRPISVQLSNGHQARVYIPVGGAMPKPGQKVAVFDAGQALGQKRFVAMIYNPHVAVVSGS